MNVLPLPALDGGYLALLALEAVRGKKVGPFYLPCALPSVPLSALLDGVFSNIENALPPPPFDASAPLQINKDVEAGIQGAGVLLLVGAGGALVVRDTLHLLQ